MNEKVLMRHFYINSGLKLAGAIYETGIGYNDTYRNYKTHL